MISSKPHEKPLITRRTALIAGGAGLAAAGCSERVAPAAMARFEHGVASGDPAANSVVIWTRATPVENGDLEIAWQVSEDETFNTVVAQGAVTTTSARDYTVKAVAEGLEPGGAYFYRFIAGQTISPVGRTRTLPVGGVDSARFAVVSCSNYPFGFFNVYSHIARRDDVDFVIHLGDYIYEYAPSPDAYGGAAGARLGREHAPARETVSLADYRMRHAQYKSDAGAQAVHASAPFIMIWDDHEFTNDSFRNGAENHQPETEGDWAARTEAALQAYYEWMPVRDPGDTAGRKALWRSYDFGDLATVISLESRVMARARQIDYAKDIPPLTTPFDFSNPEAPVPVTDPARLADLDAAAVRYVPTPFDMTAEPPQPMLNFDVIRDLDPENLPEGLSFLPDRDTFVSDVLGAPDRALLGEEQQSFLAAELKRSADDGKPWQVLANQVLMARLNMPDVTSIVTEDMIAAVQDDFKQIREFIALSKLRLPLNPDAWDGYPAAREKLYAAAADAGADLLVLTGDTHSFWANTLHDADGVRRGVELGTTSVTSPGFAAQFVERGLDLPQLLNFSNPEINYLNPMVRGYIHLTLTKSEAKADFVTVSTIESETFETETLRTYAVTKSSNGLQLQG